MVWLRPSPKGISVPTFVVMEVTEMEKDGETIDTMIGVDLVKRIFHVTLRR